MVNTADTSAISVATAMLIMSSVALAAYLTALVAIYRVRKTTKHEFYWLLFAMGISDCTMLTFLTVYPTWATYVQEWPLGSQFDSRVGGVTSVLTYFTSLSLLVNIAFNRYIAICRKNTTQQMPNIRKIVLSIALCFGFGVVCAIPQLTPCCAVHYFPSEFYYGYDMDLAGNQVYIWYDRLVNVIAFTFLIASYSMILHKVRQARKAVGPSTSTGGVTGEISGKQKAEFHLAVQMSVVSSLFFTQDFWVTVVPLITDNEWWNFAGTVLYIMVLGVHPFVYFKFNSKIRQQMINVIKCKKGSDTGDSQLFQLNPKAVSIRMQQITVGGASSARS